MALTGDFVSAALKTLWAAKKEQSHPSQLEWWHRYLLTGWLFILSTAGLSCYRVVRIFAKILRSPD